MTEAKHEIFISYAREDQTFARRLMDVLEAQGVPYWADRKIERGTRWFDEIEAALRRASVFVLIISPDFQTSESALFEAGVSVGRAQESGAVVVPILLPGAVLPAVLRGYQAVHAESMTVEAIAARLGAIAASHEQKTEPLLKQMTLFVSAAGDVTAERECVARVVDELNVKVGRTRGIELRRFTWETQLAPAIAKYPQAAINDALREVDVLLLILGTRFGTVPDVGLGVEEEFRVFFDKWKLTGRPTVFCYVKSAPMKVDSLEQLEQFRRVLEFKESLRSTGIVHDFESVDDLERQVRVHLMRVIAPAGAA